MYEIHKGFVFKRLTVIHVTWGDHETQEFSALITYQMQLESEESSHKVHLPLCAIPLNIL